MGNPKLFLFLMTLFYSLIGLMTFFSGEVFIAIREIALNTRDKTFPNPEQYNGLNLMQLFCKILGVMIILGSWITFFRVM